MECGGPPRGFRRSVPCYAGTRLRFAFACIGPLDRMVNCMQSSSAKDLLLFFMECGGTPPLCFSAAASSATHSCWIRRAVPWIDATTPFMDCGLPSVEPGRSASRIPAAFFAPRELDACPPLAGRLVCCRCFYAVISESAAVNINLRRIDGVFPSHLCALGGA